MLEFRCLPRDHGFGIEVADLGGPPSEATFVIEVGCKGGKYLRDYIEDIQAPPAIKWITHDAGKWWLNFDRMRQIQTMEPFISLEAPWLKGSVSVEPYETTEAKKISGWNGYSTRLEFKVSENDVKQQNASKVFLSHKGSNKAEVEQYFQTLKALGFDPWLDDDAMPAGADLHRSISDGFTESCAVVFFITPEFKDEAYIKREIDYAVREETARPGFKIIALVFKNERGETGVVPEVLKTKVYKHPKCQLEALREILRALPLKIGSVLWR